MLDEESSGAPLNFRWIVDGVLAGSGLLSHPEQIEWLEAQGIGAIVSTVQLMPELYESMDNAGFEHLYLPVEDFGVPSDAQVDRFIRFVDKRMERGVPVLVHCAAGIGRTGTLCALWLVQHGKSVEEALERVGVESPAQRELVERWGLDQNITWWDP